MIDKIKKELISNQDLKYAHFSSKLLPGINNILGVRLPILRKLAKNILKNDWQEFLKFNDNNFFELIMLEGMVVSGLKIEFQEHIKYIEEFIPKINSWSVCDSFCSGLKIINSHKKEFKKFIEPYFSSDMEYFLRFPYVILLNYYMDDIDYVLEKIKIFDKDKYYAKMAVAWCLSYCFIADYSKTKKFILKNKIHSWVLNKGITKAIESLKISKFQKEELKKLRNITRNL